MGLLKEIVIGFIDSIEKLEQRKATEKKRKDDIYNKLIKEREEEEIKNKALQIKKEQARKIEVISNRNVHKKFVKFVELASFYCPTSLIDKVYLSIEENVNFVSEICIEEKKITICLNSLLYLAFRSISDNYSIFSFRAELWMQFMCQVLKRFVQACEKNGDQIDLNLEDQRSVLQDNETVGKLLSYLGSKYDIEPPSLSEDLFFGPLITNLIEDGIIKNEAWAKKQKEMIHFINMWPHNMNLAPLFIRDYFKWATGNLENPNWPKYVPPFKPTDLEVEATKKDNIKHKNHLAKWALEDKKFQEDMALLESVDKFVKDWEDENWMKEKKK